MISWNERDGYRAWKQTYWSSAAARPARGIAWDLALRGVRVVLAEMGDLATGTSGRYHGLLHSGGRYAVRDAESAKECIDENRIVRRIAPEAIEPTSGYFVLCPGDDQTYVDQWLTGCAAVGIETRAVSLGEALKREPALNPKLEAVYEVPDGTCDSWDLLHCLQKGAEATGQAQFLTYHRLVSFRMENNHVVGAQLRNLRDDSTVDVTCACRRQRGGTVGRGDRQLAGADITMRLSRGAMLAYNIRWVNTVINKLRAPGDGDIFVPVGTVSVIGTTSVTTDDPGDTRVEAWEVTRILDEAEAMTPGISRARILRAWGGVRPLYDPGSGGREAKRTFTVLDHADADRNRGFRQHSGRQADHLSPDGGAGRRRGLRQARRDRPLLDGDDGAAAGARAQAAASPFARPARRAGTRREPRRADLRVRDRDPPADRGGAGGG